MTAEATTPVTARNTVEHTVGPRSEEEAVSDDMPHDAPTVNEDITITGDDTIEGSTPGERHIEAAASDDSKDKQTVDTPVEANLNTTDGFIAGLLREIGWESRGKDETPSKTAVGGSASKRQTGPQGSEANESTGEDTKKKKEEEEKVKKDKDKGKSKTSTDAGKKRTTGPPGNPK